MLTGHLGKLGPCYIFLEPDMIGNNKAASRRWSKIGSYLSRVPSSPPHPRTPSLFDNPLKKKISYHLSKHFNINSRFIRGNVKPREYYRSSFDD